MEKWDPNLGEMIHLKIIWQRKPTYGGYTNLILLQQFCLITDDNINRRKGYNLQRILNLMVYKLNGCF